MNIWEALLTGLGQGLAFFFDLIPSYGVAIILVTLSVKVITLPLTIKSTRSMRAMQKVQPEIKKLQEKYKGDKQKQSEAQMKLFKEHGVNPLGGCLPLLLQMPIFFALYRVFNGVQYLPKESALVAAIAAGHAGFLGMDLGLTPLQAYTAGAAQSVFAGVVAISPYIILIGIMAFTAWYQQKQLSKGQTSAQQGQAQMISRMFVFMFPVFSFAWPIALTLYWTTNNVWQIAQQYFMLAGENGGTIFSQFLPVRGPKEVSPSQVAGSSAGTSSSPAPPRHKGSGAKKGKRKK